MTLIARRYTCTAEQHGRGVFQRRFGNPGSTPTDFDSSRNSFQGGAVNKEAHEFILNLFCEQRGLSIATVSQGLADTICAATAPYLLMVECLDQLDAENPVGGLLVTLLRRTYETSAGCLVLIALGQLREAEILSRSVFESAATTAYIVRKDPTKRLAQFFRAYVGNEREQNRKWNNDTDDMPPDLQREHQSRIDQKSLALDSYDRLIDGFLRHCGTSLEENDRWPNLIERLSEIGRRIDYRTVYAAMCSQAHHDAEDILNNLLVNSLVEDNGETQRMEQEADSFSIFLVLFGLRWFVEATRSVGVWAGFPTVMSEAAVSVERIDKELGLIASHLDTGGFPRSWIPESEK